MTFMRVTTGPIQVSGGRIDERHVAYRFGDFNWFKAGVDDGGKWAVALDGVDITNICTEAYAGRDGWALVWRDHFRRQEFVTGVVTVSYGPREDE